jgi:hypothetical protein
VSERLTLLRRALPVLISQFDVAVQRDPLRLIGLWDLGGIVNEMPDFVWQRAIKLGRTRGLKRRFDLYSIVNESHLVTIASESLHLFCGRWAKRLIPPPNAIRSKRLKDYYSPGS